MKDDVSMQDGPAAIDFSNLQNLEKEPPVEKTGEARKMFGEIEMEYREEKTQELFFRQHAVVSAPPTLCPYCYGRGYNETGDDTHECKVCNGSGRNNR